MLCTPFSEAASEWSLGSTAAEMCMSTTLISELLLRHNKHINFSYKVFAVFIKFHILGENTRTGSLFKLETSKSISLKN